METDRELKKEVFRVADDLYCYKHYFLPINHFESSVFVFKHGIDCIENSEAFREKRYFRCRRIYRGFHINFEEFNKQKSH